MWLAEAQPLPTDPRPCCNAGASRERPNLSFIVLFCSASILDFPFTHDFSISSLLYSPGMPCSDSSGNLVMANSSACQSLGSPCSAGGLLSRASKLNAVWGCFPRMGLWWWLLPFDLLLHLVDRKLNMSQQCVLAAQKPTTSWAASRAAWPAGQGRGFCPFTPL